MFSKDSNKPFISQCKVHAKIREISRENAKALKSKLRNILAIKRKLFAFKTAPKVKKMSAPFLLSNASYLKCS